MPRVRKLVGYCNRCGGDCYDDGVKNFHRCPRVRPEATAVVAAKFACDDFLRVMQRRSWAKIVNRDDCAELEKAVSGLQDALSKAYPHG